MMIFTDRIEAGQVLGVELKTRYRDARPVVLGLPRGGVVVAAEVATQLAATLDVFVVRKIGCPWCKEIAMGAVASGNIVVRNKSVLAKMRISEREFQKGLQRELVVLARREKTYRGDRPPVVVRDRSVILVDDGLATGATMRAAVEGVRARRPKEIIVAVPLGARETCETLRPTVDDLVCLATPEPFFSVGQWYYHFDQTTDDEVHRLLETANKELSTP